MANEIKRAAQRVKAKSGNQIIYLEGSGGVRDLSVNAMFVIDKDPLPGGAKISFVFHTGSMDMELQGIVVRSEPEQGMAIQFTDLTREATRRLKIYVADLAAASLDTK